MYTNTLPQDQGGGSGTTLSLFLSSLNAILDSGLVMISIICAEARTCYILSLSATTLFGKSRCLAQCAWYKHVTLDCGLT